MAGGSGEAAAALGRLDEITRRLRRECPWDREQDERSIVPHTVEEAYELADAAHSRDDRRLLDELGDVLFQVLFLSLLMEERGAGDLGAVADHCREKLIRRHPHVFGDVEAKTAGDVVRAWSAVKRDEERGGDLFGELPETLPATLYAKKLIKRAAAAGRIAPPPDGGADPFEAAGDRLLDAVQRAVEAGVDPELALRGAAERMRTQIEQEVRK